MDKLKPKRDAMELPRLIISLFFVALLATAFFSGMNVLALLSDVIKRWGMYGILVLAMVPAIVSGIAPNMGIPVGICGGLLGAVIAVEVNIAGMPAFADNPEGAAFWSFLFAIGLALIICIVLGIGYGWLLNRVKGSEMTVATYVGYSFVALMNIMWIGLPFKSGEIIWPVSGEGARATISLAGSYSNILDNAFRITSAEKGGLNIPTGMILFVLSACLVIWLFLQTQKGASMSAVGSNGRFAGSAGVSQDKMRMLGTVISTVLGGVGIIVYSQSYGFMQLYNAPKFMGFTCVACVLIGGASLRKAKVSHAIIGTLLFQGILAVALPIANVRMEGSILTDIIRILLTNGIILYAVTKAGEDDVHV